MIKLPYTVTAIEKEIIGDASDLSLASGAVISINDENGDPALMFDSAIDEVGDINKLTGANGQKIIYVYPGVYSLTVGGSVSAFVIGATQSEPENLTFVPHSEATLVVDGDSAGNHYYLTNAAGCEITVNESVFEGDPFPGAYVSFTAATDGYVRLVAGVGITINSPFGLDFYAQWATASIISSDQFTWNATGALD